MTILDRNPINTNFLQPNKFQLNFSRCPNVRFFAQALIVPGLTIGEAIQPTPFIDVYAPGDKAIFDMLNVTFIVDEELETYKEIYDWLRAMSFPESFADYRSLPNLNNYTRIKQDVKPQYSDCTVTLLSSANNPIVEFKYYDVFPTMLSSIMLSSSDSPEAVVTADAAFRYTYYDIIKL